VKLKFATSVRAVFEGREGAVGSERRLTNTGVMPCKNAF
jgi:hypothetical protein